MPKPIRDFLTVTGKDKKRLSITFRAEDSTYAVEQNATIDRRYYIEQIRTPVVSAFDLPGIPDVIRNEVNSIFKTISDALKKDTIQRIPLANCEWRNTQVFGGRNEVTPELKNAIIQELAIFQNQHQAELTKHLGADFKFRIDFDGGIRKVAYLGDPILQLTMPCVQYCLPHQRIHTRTTKSGAVTFILQITKYGVRIQCLKAGAGAHWPNQSNGLQTSAMKTIFDEAYKSINQTSIKKSLPPKSQSNTAGKRKSIENNTNNQKMTSFFQKKPKTIISMGK